MSVAANGDVAMNGDSSDENGGARMRIKKEKLDPAEENAMAVDAVKVKQEKVEDHKAEQGHSNGGSSQDQGHQPTVDEEDENDPVVHEIPVYLAKSLAQQLYLLQYPVRPCRMSYDTSTVLSAKVKPKQKKVEVTMALNTECTNFDNSKGEQIALNVDGQDAKERAGVDDETMVFPDGQMDRLTLSSTQTLQDTSRYAIGILDADEFHLTPLHAVLSLRPSFEYLDKSDKTAKAEGRGGLGDEDEDEAAAEADEAAKADAVKAVTVKFAKGGKMDQERAEKMREKSFEWQMKKAKQEPWQRCVFNHVKSAKWSEKSQQMFCKSMDDQVPDLNLTSKEYLQSLKEHEKGNH